MSGWSRLPALLFALAGLASADSGGRPLGATGGLPVVPTHIDLAATPEALKDLEASLDRLVTLGYDRPDAALAELSRVPAVQTQGQTARRVALLARGLILAGVGRGGELAGTLNELGQLGSDPLGTADAALVQATLSDSRGETAPVIEAAQAALTNYVDQCPNRPGCDYRSIWRALQLLSRHNDRRGYLTMAREQSKLGATLAQQWGDVGREALSLAVEADLSGRLGDISEEQRLLAEAQRLGRQDGSALLAARLYIWEQRISVRQGNLAAARRAVATGLALAREAHSPRLTAIELSNMADVEIREKHPARALACTQEALPLARALGDRRTELSLLENASLAQIGLGRVAEARQGLDQVLAAFRQGGATGFEAVALREFADALAAAGDLKGALEMFHRERQLSTEISAINREATLAELRSRYNREAQQRQLAQLERDNALMNVQLGNRTTAQRVWFASLLILALAVLLVVALYRRVRDLNHRLARNQGHLRILSQRDDLTGLVNRHGLHERARLQGVQDHFSGVLLLVDIDHFKHVNDAYGHLAGDRVLIEVARRLSEVVRSDDLVVRWGGEEFLIYMPGVGAAEADAVASRVLHVVAADPVRLETGPLQVSVSLGYGGFPLPPSFVQLSLQGALCLVDRVMYTAKQQGRNRAFGLVSAAAESAEALRALTDRFDEGLAEGQISLKRTHGPPLNQMGGPSFGLSVVPTI